MSEDNARFEKCPICQSPLRVTGKYATVYVYQCTGPKCRRKWNHDALEARAYEQRKNKKK